ncbi:SpoIIE family protein phosphatase [Actinoplanes sp. NPDC051343]|uniref:SpoIIE family protein phosphatase n=1 Tax=Actinoplanes sp. NPDC051343 TaxID=3363906 RepID=UPI0037A9CD34
MTDPTAAGGLSGRARLDALASTRLGPRPDPAFDRFTRMVRRTLGVPVALVSLVDDTRQYFPGAAGLAQPWQRCRETGLSHSFCRHVVLSGRPLIVADARTDALLRDNLAIKDLGVVAYSGMPLTDDDGNVLGSLCAIDTSPRDWTSAELETLADLASACASELRLRIAAHQAEQARTESGLLLEQRRSAEEEARGLSAEVQLALARSRLLLRASEALADTSTVTDVVAAVASLVSGDLAPAHVAVMFRDSRRERLDLVTTHPLPPGTPPHWSTTPLDSEHPAAVAVRSRRPVFLGDRATLAHFYPELADDVEHLGWHALVCAPLLGTSSVLGTLRFAWDQPHAFDTGEQAVITTLAGYVALALERAQQLQARADAARTLQEAMLPDLPSISYVELAACYYPANAGEHIGGDWYDAVPNSDGRLALVIGDVSGHDMNAAARMGQLRSMLRAFLIDRHEPPSALLRRLDTANHALGDSTIATAIVGYLDPQPGGGYQLQWSNAGHPPPVLLQPNGTVEALAGRDLLLGSKLLVRRRNQFSPLPAGSTLLLYTDGLIETRTGTVDEGSARLHERLRQHATTPLPELLADIVTHVAANRDDDVAALAVRLPA